MSLTQRDSIRTTLDYKLFFANFIPGSVADSWFRFLPMNLEYCSFARSFI